MKLIKANNLITCLQIMSTKNDSTVWEQCIGIVNSLPDEQPRWIPVSEKLPEEEGFYLVTMMPVEAPDKSFTEKCRFFKDKWYEGFLTNISENYMRVIAWMPLPEPYKMDEVTE